MKKFIITIITVIAAATVFTSCGNKNQKAIDSLTQIQDSLQFEIDWRTDAINHEMADIEADLESPNVDAERIEYRIINVKNLQEEVRENKAKVEAIQIEIAKLQ